MAILKFDQYSDHAKAAWKSCMASAFRTSLACVIVGVITLFGPARINRHITLPAFSYVTVVLVVTDAALGDALRGCWHAAYASLTGILPAILSLWLIGPGRMAEPGILAAAVGASAFVVVVVQEKSHLISKRIALGQIVLVYVFASINGSDTDPVMHPVGVLVSTAVGVAACVIALVIPYPSLATSEVKTNFKLCTKTASERLKLFVKAFSAEDKSDAHALLSQANILAKIGTKLLRTIKFKQDGMMWERLPFTHFLNPYCTNPVEKLQHLETPLKGMEIALSSSETLIPVKILNSDLKHEISRTEEHIACQIKSMSLLSAITMPENTFDHRKLPQALQNIPLEHQDLPSLFFLFCLKLLQKKFMAPKKGVSTDDSAKKEAFLKGLGDLVSSRRLMPALKCSLSLFLAVFLGSIYSKENAHWAGLPVAVSFVATREATFKIANIKAQGTVLGTVYGVFGCFMFQKYAAIMLLSLVPWFIFCSFLRRSRMYGQAGGISAVIGAVLILGRKNFGPPSEFAIARITETFIGLSCSIFVELILQPTRASALAKIELSKNLHVLRHSISGIGFNPISRKPHLKIQVNELGKFVQEAEVEPNFWFLPFPSACYGKVLDSLSKMVNFLTFTNCAIESMHQELGGNLEGNFLKENLDKLNLDLNLFKQILCSSLKFCEEVNLVKSLNALDKEVERKKVCVDLEMGKPKGALFTSTNEEVMEKRFSKFLDHCNEFLDGIKGENEEEREMKSQIVLSLSALAFCMNGMIRESKEVEKSVNEIVQWENPSRLVDFHDISRKISALGALQEEEEKESLKM